MVHSELLSLGSVEEGRAAAEQGLLEVPVAVAASPRSGKQASWCQSFYGILESQAGGFNAAHRAEALSDLICLLVGGVILINFTLICVVEVCV